MNLQDLVYQVRRDIVRQVHGASSGHPGGSLGCVELMVALYFEVMEHNPQKFTIDGTGEDLFFLSNGHISPVWYSVLARSNYFGLNELSTFRKINSRLQGHPTNHDSLPGIRTSSGSLGQGLSVALGAASAKKLNNDDKIVWCLMGDGELQEGQVWEALMWASGKKIDNVVAIVDVNGQQIDGSTEQVLSLGNLQKKWEAFGWNVISCKGGNNLEEVIKALNYAKDLLHKNSPVVILLETQMGNGVSFMMGSHKWHGIAPNNEQLEIALSENKSNDYKDYE